MTDYSELIKALRGLANGIWKNCEYTWFSGEEKVFADAADEIEALVKINHRFRELLDNRNKDVAELQRKIDELTSQLQKRGEWELIDGAEPMRWGCSRCKYMSWETSTYCPRCGAKMEVQDG